MGIGVLSASAQPDYLVSLISDIEHQQDVRFIDALLRVRERTAAGVYSQSDLAFIAHALVNRAERSPELRPDIITLLGQIGLPETVPVIMNYARSGDAVVRLHAYQALGWIGDERALPLLVSALSQATAAQADTQNAFMLAYAVQAIKLKQRLRPLPSDEQFSLVRSTLQDEPNWLVRADIAGYLVKWPGNEVWEAIFDSYTKWPDPPVYANRLAETLARRYQFNSAGFMMSLRRRPVEVRLFGLQTIQDIADANDLGALMEMAETDPDRAVREQVIMMLGRLMNR